MFAVAMTPPIQMQNDMPYRTGGHRFDQRAQLFWGVNLLTASIFAILLSQNLGAIA